VIVEAVDPHLRHRQRVERFGERDRAAIVGVAVQQHFEAGLLQLGLEVARDLDNRGAGIGAIGDAGDTPFEPPLVGGLAVLEGGGLQPRRVEILELIARDDAAGEAPDAGIVTRAGDVAALLRLRRHAKHHQHNEYRANRPPHHVLPRPIE
jgi:hypothetical protein